MRSIRPGFEWLYVTAFVSPATGESFWRLSNGVSKPFFEALLRLFAEQAGAGRERRIVLTLDNAGWRGETGLVVPDGLRLVFQPAYTPEAPRPRRCGRWSTSRSSTSPSPPSKPSTQSSRRDAPPSPANAKKSRARPASTGGRKSPTRGDHPETVLVMAMSPNMFVSNCAR
jgi:hypothetical protein